MSGQTDIFGAPDVGGERDESDRYYTPPWATRALLHHMGDRLRGDVWEPCAGQGHIADVLESHPSVNDVLRTDIIPSPGHDVSARGVGLDFVDPEEPHRYWPGWVVTNPPYRTARGDHATDFVDMALRVAGRGVAMLLRVGWIEPCDDRAVLFMEDPPTDYVVLPRVNYIGAPSSNNQTSVWFVWDRRADTPAGMARVRHYPADIREPTFDWSRL